jgi:hypothetical protein
MKIISITAFATGLAMVVPALAQAPSNISLQLQDLGELKILVGNIYGSGAAVKNAPYSADAVTESTQVFADGNRIERKTTQKLYRDSDGRERREESVLAVGALAEAEMPHLITISDPVENVSYTLNPRQRTAQRSTGLGLMMNWFTPDISLNKTGMVTIGQGNAGRSGAQIPNGAKVAKEDLGSKNIEGVIAQGSRTTETIPAGQIGNLLPINVVDEVWHSAELQMDVMTTHSDPRSGEVVYKLTNISRANPSRTMFEPPADYTVTATGPGRGRGARGPAPGAQK